MAARIGLGPVFAFEWLTTTRRWQLYAMRLGFVGVLLLGLMVVWSTQVQGQSLSSIRAMAAVGQAFYLAIVGIQLALVMLAAPAATAGAICLDKARGNLLLLLATDLSSAEIVLGKLAARLAPVLGLIACTLPVTALGTLLGGIDPVALTGAFLVTIGVAVFGCTLALALSIWASKPHEVLLATYAVWILWLLAKPIWSTLAVHPVFQWLVWHLPVDWLWRWEPFTLVFAPYLRPGTTMADHMIFFGSMLAFSLALAILSVLRVRAVCVRQAGQPSRAGRKKRGVECLYFWNRLLPAPSLDDNPVLWREWHRKRPSRWVVTVWGLYVILGVIFGLIGLGEIASGAGGPMAPPIVTVFTTGLVVCVGMLLLSVSSATALAEERVRGSLDVILTTPLSTPSIVWGKWLGAFRLAPLLAVLPVVLTSGLAFSPATPFRPLGILLMLSLILAYGAAITSLGVALATWTPRLGRAVGWNVSALVLATVGLFFLAVVLFPEGPVDGAMSLLFGSMFAGPVFLQVGLCENRPEWPTAIFWCCFWIGLYGTAAAVLYGATVRTFDRCLGRISEPGVPGVEPRHGRAWISTELDSEQETIQRIRAYQSTTDPSSTS